MEGSSSKGKRKVVEISSGTSKKSKGEVNEVKRQLNQYMIHEMDSPKDRSRKAKVNLPIHDQLEDKYKEIGDVFTIVRGHELFLFHYFCRDEPMPIPNPCSKV